MSGLDIPPPISADASMPFKGNPPGEDNGIILCYGVFRDDDIHNLMAYPETLPT